MNEARPSRWQSDDMLKAVALDTCKTLSTGAIYKAPVDNVI